jgi:MFS family permease
LAIVLAADLVCYMDRMVMASAIPFIGKDFHLSPLAMGGVLRAFFVGYSVMQVPGGLLADRFGPRAVAAGGITWWSLMTALTGLSTGLTSLLAIRLLFGFGEGPFPPAVSKIFSIWFPKEEIGRANGLQLALTAIGGAMAPLLVVALIRGWGWRYVYFVLFAPGMVVAILVWAFVRNARADSRYVAPQELAEFDPAPPEKIAFRKSLNDALKTPSVLWCAACLFLSNSVAWGLAN